jgi:glutaminyl-peptide cyclotransferase
VQCYNCFHSIFFSPQNVLVLLDLIGAGNERFVCTFRNTCSLNQRLWQIENTLQSASTLRKLPNSPANIFLKSFKRSGVSDDHEPFLHRGVPILHLIPTSFPRTWHTPADNGQNLDINSINNFNKVMRVFVVDYISTCADKPKSSACAFK